MDKRNAKINNKNQMPLKDKLQIILITYNRGKHVQYMLDTLLAKNSPAKDLNILVLDNNSTDNTSQVVETFKKKHSNLCYCKNHYNLGIGGNIARAMELASSEYVWILGDDDELHFEAWPDLEEAIIQDKEIIIAARYAIKKGHEQDLSFLVGQLTFISSGIFKTSLFTDTVMSNVINNIYTLFPHLVPVVEYINEGKANNIYVLPRALVSNGMSPETDCSYIRGYESCKLYLKQSSMSWIVGYANVLIQLKDKKLIYSMMDNPIRNGIFTGWLRFYRFMQIMYANNNNWIPVFEVLRAIPLRRKIELLLYLLVPVTIYKKDNGYFYFRIWCFKTKIWKVRNKHVSKG